MVRAPYLGGSAPNRGGGAAKVGEFTKTGCESERMIGLRRELEGEGRGGQNEESTPSPGEEHQPPPPPPPGSDIQGQGVGSYAVGAVGKGLGPVEGLATGWV